MPTKQTIDAARKEGYSDQEIADHLAKTNPKLNAALREGYSAKEVIDYIAQDTEQARPPVPWTDAIRDAGKHAVTNLVGGVRDLTTLAVAASPFNPNPVSRFQSAVSLGRTAAEMVMRPVRELGGIRQPGESPSTFQPLPVSERPFAALATGLLGAEPERVRERIAAGDERGAMAERLAPAVVAGGVAGALRATSPARVRNVTASTAKLGKALGRSEGAKSLLTNREGGTAPLETLFPRLERATTQRSATLPTGHAVAQFETRMRPRSLEDLREANSQFLRNSENEYNIAVQTHANARVDVAQEMARRFRGKMKREVDPASSAAEVHAFNRELEQAAVREESGAPYSGTGMTIGDLDAARRLNFEKIKDPIAEALKERSDASRTMDRVREEVYRDLIYDELGRLTGKGDYWRNLKRDQAIAIELEQVLRDRIPDVNMNLITREPISLRDLGTVYVQGGRAGGRAYPAHILSKLAGADSMVPAKAGKLVSGAFRPRSAFPIPRTTIGTGLTQSAGQGRQYPLLPEDEPLRKALP